MMNRKLFEDIVIDRIMDYMPPIYSEYEPVTEKVNKVNEVKTALMLLPGGEDRAVPAPMVYLDDMYEMFGEREDLDETLKFIANIFMNNISRSFESVDEYFDFKRLRNRVVMQLINTERNEKLLEDIPHTDVINMSVIYRVIMQFCDDGGFDSVIVNDHIAKELEVDREELHRLAVRNTQEIFEPVILNLSDKAIMVSNKYQTFGSSSMLIGEVMEDVGSRLGAARFYIVPCSIHEFIAVQYEKTDLESLVAMLAEGNREFTREKEILSNSIYLYELKGQKLSKVASYLHQ